MKDITKVIHRDTENQIVKYYVLGVNDWDFFNSLVSFFIKYYGAVVENSTDGINTRSWQLRVESEHFILEHSDDLGNCFYSCDKTGDSELMHSFSDDLENRLKKVPYD